MMFQNYACLLLVISTLLMCLSNGADPETITKDQVTLLPGLKTPPQFKHYSGYLDASNGQHLHYWFVESEWKPATAPLVLWLSGGPGCSSIYSLLTEHGPFRVKKNASAIYVNHYSWNKEANIIYLDAPAGVGFSYSDSQQYATNDTEVAISNLAALNSFFKKFPEYKRNEFYIAGQNYGSIFVTTLSALVLKQTDTINFKGFAIGNGVHCFKLNTNTKYLYLAFRGIISPATFKRLLANCCKTGNLTSCNFQDVPVKDVACHSAVVAATNEENDSGIDPYDIYKSCQPSKRASFQYLAEKYQPLANLHENLGNDTFNGTQENGTSSGDGHLPNELRNITLPSPCVDDSAVREWMNRPDVRDALHIPKNVTAWQTCSEAVEVDYTRVYDTTHDLYKTLLPKVRALIYHGDTDSVCNYIGGERFTESLNLTVLQKYRKWTFLNKTAGFVINYQNLTFATVLGAGHVVAADKPGPAFKLFANFLNNKPIN